MYLAIIILPLLGSIVSGFFGRKIGVSGSQIITCTAVIMTTVFAVVAFFEVGLNNILSEKLSFMQLFFSFIGVIMLTITTIVGKKIFFFN